MDELFANQDLESMIENSKNLVEKLLGRKLGAADPLILFLRSILSIIYNQHALINENARQNLLAYARGSNLDALGVLVGVARKAAASATCTAEVTLSAARAKTTIIPAGTRFNAGDDVHFALNEDVIFLAGEVTKRVSACCLTAGDVGNGYGIGELCKIVDFTPFLGTIRNVTASAGGAAIEGDDNLRERIRLAPESFSVAGPKGAYEFYCKDFSSEIIDAYVDSPTPGVVDIYFLLYGGEIPGAEMLSGVYDHLNAETIRPLTDFVRVFPPVVIDFDLDVSYQISITEKTRATSIIEAVESAVSAYVLWQKSKIGRDIEPSELIRLMRNAGADRITVRQPEFLATPPNAVAVCKNCYISYEGLKDI